MRDENERGTCAFRPESSRRVFTALNKKGEGFPHAWQKDTRMSIDRISPHAMTLVHAHHDASGKSQNIHIVDRGESLADIAKHYQVDKQALLAANPTLLHPGALSPGERITIPELTGGNRIAVPDAPSGPAIQLDPVRFHFSAEPRHVTTGEATRSGIQKLFADGPVATPSLSTPHSAALIRPTAAQASAASDAGKRFENLKDEIPGLKNFIPQGMTTWENWKGGQDLLLIGAYSKKGHEHRVFAIDAKTGERVATLSLDLKNTKGHGVDSMAIGKKHLYITNGGEQAHRYSLKDLKDRIKEEKKDSSTPIAIQPNGNIKINGSQIAIHNGVLYSTSHKKKDGHPVIRSVELNPDGSIDASTRKTLDFKAPMRTQGMVVTDEHIIFSRGKGTQDKGEIIVFDRNTGERVKQIKTGGSLPEGIAIVNGRLHVVYESASPGFGNAKHKASHVQYIDLGELTGRKKG